MKRVLILTLAAVCAAPAWAAKKPAQMPLNVDGQGVAVDPHVAEFEAAMKQANADLAAIKASILAVQVPPGPGALAAGAKAAGEYAAVAATIAKAEAAHAKFLKHLMGWDASDDIDNKLGLKAPKFEEKKDVKIERHRDTHLQGRLAPASSGARGGGASNFAAPGGRQQFAGGGGGPSFNSVSSPFSYASGGNQVGAGFEGGLQPSVHQIAAAGVGQTGGGSGLAEGAAGAAVESRSVGAGAADAAPAAVDAARLSQNTSDTVSSAFERVRRRQQAAEAAARERQQAEGQRKQQMAQAMQQALQQAGQAMKGAEGGAGECKNCNKGKQQEAQQKAAML